MANNPNGIDLVRTPVELASAQFRDQLEAFQAQVAQGQENPVRQAYREAGIDLAKVRELSR